MAFSPSIATTYIPAAVSAVNLYTTREAHRARHNMQACRQLAADAPSYYFVNLIQIAALGMLSLPMRAEDFYRMGRRILPFSHLFSGWRTFVDDMQIDVVNACIFCGIALVSSKIYQCLNHRTRPPIDLDSERPRPIRLDVSYPTGPNQPLGIRNGEVVRITGPEYVVEKQITIDWAGPNHALSLGPLPDLRMENLKFGLLFGLFSMAVTCFFYGFSLLRLASMLISGYTCWSLVQIHWLTYTIKFQDFFTDCTDPNNRNNPHVTFLRMVGTDHQRPSEVAFSYSFPLIFPNRVGEEDTCGICKASLLENRGTATLFCDNHIFHLPCLIKRTYEKLRFLPRYIAGSKIVVHHNANDNNPITYKCILRHRVGGRVKSVESQVLRALKHSGQVDSPLPSCPICLNSTPPYSLSGSFSRRDRTNHELQITEEALLITPDGSTSLFPYSPTPPSFLMKTWTWLSRLSFYYES